ncbi:MAG: hypothetical protein RL632_2077 [Bacteroidota bacterium]|jgi:hypothetical protein
MLKKLILGLVVLSAFSLEAQRDLTPGKRRGDVFGKADYKDYRFFGLQVTGGLTYMHTRFDANNPSYLGTDSIGRLMSYSFDPQGSVGAFVDLGMVHFPKKRSKLSLALKYIFISYYDWGLGAKLFSGTETTTFSYFNALGEPMTTQTFSGSFMNGYVNGRFSLHKNVYLGKRYFIDNGLGFNLDYRLSNAKPYDINVVSMISPQTFHSSFVAQMHYSLGFGIKLNRRSMLVPGVQLPIFGIHDWRKGCSALKYYNSNYLPILFQVKFTYLFEKKAKGCNTPGTDQDRKLNDEYLQGN